MSAPNTSGDATLLTDHFRITSINSEKYDRVSRITGESTSNDLKFHLDINHDIYPIQPGQQIEMLLSTSLSLDGSNDMEQAKNGWKDIDEGGNLADGYEFVCYGKIYRFEDVGDDNIKVYVSFGGLLLYLEGAAKKLTSLKHEYIYLLIRKE